MRIRNIEVIIPTWNSMPELQDTLDSLLPAFSSALRKVIILDNYSSDATQQSAINWGAMNDIPILIVLTGKPLGGVRKIGLRIARTKWVAFIDSDIVLPRGWLREVASYISTKKVGWVYGYTAEDIEFIERAHEYKRQLRNNLPRTLKIGEFERAYTNNTVCLRKPLLDAPIDELNAWEDYVMGQHMIKKGYDVIEIDYPCDHLKHGVYEKFGNYTEKWGLVGELKAKGWNPYTLMRPFYFVYWGIRCTIHFKDFKYLQYYTGVTLGMLSAILNKAKMFQWNRDLK